MKELNELELNLLHGLTEKYPALKSHLPYLKVAERKVTSTGMIVHLTYTGSEGQFIPEDINALFSNGEIIQIKNLKKGLGYVIDITAGHIEYIELTTYGESWDGKYGDFKIVSRDIENQ
jgi:hypothetical protein